MQISGEAVLLQNIAIDFALLCAAGKLAQFKMRWPLMTLSAVLGGIYAVLSFYVSFGLIGKIVFPIVMALVAGMGKPLLRILVLCGWFWACSIALAGILFALVMLAGIGEMQDGIFIMPEIPMWFFAISALFGGVWVRLGQGQRVTSVIEQFYGDLTIQIQDNTFQLQALLDSGNMLTEPISGLPVIVVEEDALTGLDTICHETGRWRKVPYGTASGQGMMWVVMPDKLVLKWRGKQYKNHAYIGFSQQILSANQGCRAIVPAAFAAL